MKKTLNQQQIFDWLNFDVRDDHIVTGKGAAQRMVYFLRIKPRNMNILGLSERMEEEKKLQNLLDATEIVPSIFVLDKTEGLDHLKDYYSELIRKYPQFDFINSAVYDELTNVEAESTSVERAFYFILRVKNENEVDRFKALVGEKMTIYTAEREELMTVLRNYLLREFSALSILEFDERVKLSFYGNGEEFRRKRKKKGEDESLSMNEVRKKETQRVLLPLRMNFQTRYAEQNNLLRKTIVIRNWPSEFSLDCTLRQIALLSNTTMRIYLEPISPTTTNKLLARQLNEKQAAVKSSVGDAQKIAADSGREQLEKAYRGMLTGGEKMYYVTIFVEVYGKNQAELTERLDRLNSELQVQNLTKDDLIYEQREAFLSVCPFGVNHFALCSRNMPTQTIAALYPFTASKKADAGGLYIGKTTAGGPFFWNPFDRTGAATNNNIAIVGQSGQGKSYLMKKIMAYLMAQGVSIYCLDSENEYIDLFNGLYGVNLNCSGGDTIINPLELRACGDDDDYELDDPESFKRQRPLLQHLSWLREFFGLLYPEMTNDQKNILMILVQDMYSKNGITETFDVTAAAPQRYPTMTTLYEYIDDVFRNYDNYDYKIFTAEELKPILRYLYDTYKGSSSSIFNGVTNVKNAACINFMIQSLLDGDKTLRDAVIFNIVTWVWNRVVTYRKKMVFVVDELYLMMIKSIVAWLRNFAKRGRKYNASLMTSTQEIVDYDDPQIAHLARPLLIGPAHKFYFYLGDMDKKAVQSLLSLSDTELNVISESRRGYCLAKTGNEKYEVHVMPLDYEAKLFGSAGGN